jgi:hypothetical protein
MSVVILLTNRQVYVKQHLVSSYDLLMQNNQKKNKKNEKWGSSLLCEEAHHCTTTVRNKGVLAQHAMLSI